MTYYQRNWHKYPSLPVHHRRQKLVREFLDLDVIPKEWDAVRPRPEGDANPTPLDIRTPTEAEVNTILRPWRPATVRNLAAYMWSHEEHDLMDGIWIRTFYGTSDSAWRDLCDELPEVDCLFFDTYRNLDAPSRFLSEPAFFPHVGLSPEEAWNRAIFLLPELASHGDWPNDYSRDIVRDRPVRGDQLMAEAQEELRLHGPPVVIPSDAVSWSRDLAKYESLRRLQLNYWSRTVVIADIEAFQTGKVCVLGIDVRGNVVRWMRAEPEEIHEKIDTYANEGLLVDSGWLEEVEGHLGVGDKYRPDGGELAALVYGLSSS